MLKCPYRFFKHILKVYLVYILLLCDGSTTSCSAGFSLSIKASLFMALYVIIRWLCGVLIELWIHMWPIASSWSHQPTPGGRRRGRGGARACVKCGEKRIPSPLRPLVFLARESRCAAEAKIAFPRFLWHARLSDHLLLFISWRVDKIEGRLPPHLLHNNNNIHLLLPPPRLRPSLARTRSTSSYPTANVEPVACVCV